MIDIARIREEPDEIRQAMRDKGYTETSTIDRILELDEQRRALVTQLQEHQTVSNAISKEIGQLMREGRRGEAEEKKAESARSKETLKRLEEESREATEALQTLLLDVPNVRHESVPVGGGPADNDVAWQSESLPQFDFEPAPHWEIDSAAALLDFERGAKVTGAGFPFYVGKIARLQRALINFYLDIAINEGGYTEIQPPIFVNAASATGTGALPDKEAQMYEIPLDGLYAIPTAEVPVTNFFRDEILDEADLPARFCAYTPCFRREAGSYGKDVRGLNRLHAFDKVELVQFVTPEKSYEALETLREDAERVLRKLELPYRRLVLCTGDMGFTQSKTYDLEVWAAGQQRWLEVSSVSNFEAFQARRMNIRYRSADRKKPTFVHTLNGSGLAVPRVVAALLENGQQEDGSIRLPEALHRYTGFEVL